MIFDALEVWFDEEVRTGPENMAVDEWLLESVSEVPILRIYDWAGDWVSLGYFQSLKVAKEIFGEEPEYVRRWTGGGIVDHRVDVTYTLVMPRELAMARGRGCESYKAIHGAVAECLRKAGMLCELAACDHDGDSAACFEKPVAWDLLGAEGEKIAGAGQRRSRYGTLHQGSVIASKGALDDLPQMMSQQHEVVEFSPQVNSDRYEAEAWLRRVL